MKFIFTTFILLITSGYAQTIHAAAERKPNLIFILTDDQRQDSLGCYGNTFIKTPHIDRLAKEGTLFEQAFVTSAICTPSRACYFLGQYERRHAVNFNSGTALTASAWNKSYPIILRKNGYYTGYVGKNHVPIGKSGYETGLMDQSFDFWYAAHGRLGFYPKKRHPRFADAQADTQIEIINEGAQSFLNTKKTYLKGAEAFLKQRPDNQPFCLSICLNVPHAASTSKMKLLPSDPELYRSTYRDQIKSIPLPSHYTAKSSIQSPKLPSDVLQTQYRQNSYDYVDTKADLGERLIREYQTITGVDRMLGAIRDQLETLNISDNTVIIFASDHGVMHGEYGLGGKALNYEACLKVPMLIMDPRLPEKRVGQRLDSLVLSIDIAPTLLDFAGISPPDAMQGNSLLPLLKGKTEKWRSYAFAENLWSTVFGNPRIESVRSKQWKYIRYFKNDHSLWDQLGKGLAKYRTSPEQAALYTQWLTSTIHGEKPVYEELFDIKNDPSESTNLASNPHHLQTLQQMRVQASRLVREARGPLDVPAQVLRLSQSVEPR